MQIKTFNAFEFPENCYAAIFDDGIFLVDPGEFTFELEKFVTILNTDYLNFNDICNLDIKSALLCP